MTKKSWAYPCLLILTSIWLGWTVLVDFYVVPTVFQTIHDFFMAGELGMALFSQLNSLELVISSLLIALAFVQFKINKMAKPIIYLSLIGLLISLFYFSYLTPKITELTHTWMKSGSDSNGLDIQQEHQFYHNLYLRIDTFKLVVLTFFLGTLFRKRDKWA